MKKIALNIFILIATYAVPVFVFRQHQDDSNLSQIQIFVFVAILIGGILLTYLNHKYRKQALEKKWIWTIFEIIGILGVLYSGVILLILYSFRHGIGF